MADLARLRRRLGHREGPEVAYGWIKAIEINFTSQILRSIIVN